MTKITSTLVLFLALLTSCGNSEQEKAVNDAKELQAAVKEMQPGGIPTTANGWMMTAKINGKSWSANSIISPEAAGRIIGDNNGESIGLPYNRRNMVVGNKSTFSNDNAVDLMTNDEVGIWAGYAGEMEITKVEGDWAEGLFHVTGSSRLSDKTIQVTEGFFRISLAK